MKKVRKKIQLPKTRFPPEPSGCLHLGHFKAILLNSFISSKNFINFNFKPNEKIEFLIPSQEELEKTKREVQKLLDKKNDIKCMNYFEQEIPSKLYITNKSINLDSECQTNLHLRFDDTNPSKAGKELVEKILDDLIKFEIPFSTVSFSSDYFKEFNILICRLLKEGKAFIDFESPEMIKEKRMNGIESEFRNQSNIEVEKGFKRIFDMYRKRNEEKDKISGNIQSDDEDTIGCIRLKRMQC